jgi:DNA modification methylase
VWEHDGKIYCLDGKHRFLDLVQIQKNGMQVPELLPATFINCTDIKEAAELVLVFSSAYAAITKDGLSLFIKKFELDFPQLQELLSIPNLDITGFNTNEPHGLKDTDFIIKNLQQRFIIPPFSIFDSRQGYWQDRKKQWHSLGFNSQETREDIELVAKSGQAPAIYELRNKMRERLGREPLWDEIIAEAKNKGMHIYEGASVFDPVLAEICYKWFCPEGGMILDPFAGGSVRGIVAGILGFDYLGIDLRPEQVRANIDQWENLRNPDSDIDINWIAGDSNEMLENFPAGENVIDFIFSCPPYFDLEQYSEDPADLSNMTYEKFLDVYRSIIFKSLTKLKTNRFACFVVGDIRDEKGFYRDFVSETIDAFTHQSLCDGNPIRLYNEIILINVAGSLPVRVGRQFETGRKVGKMHQNVLVFYKGDPKKIKENFPEIKVVEYLQELNYQPNIALSVID